KEVVIPSLQLEKPADENDQSAYPRNLNLVDLYLKSRDAIVQVNGWSAGKDNPLSVQFSGTGFFVSSEGRLATNFHVIQDRKDLEVVTFDGKKYKATIEKVDVPNDLAVLKLDAGGQTFPT